MRIRRREVVEEELEVGKRTVEQGAVRVRSYVTETPVQGVANLGIRPQFEPPKELLEPHFFDFAGDLYGRTVLVEFAGWIRGDNPATKTAAAFATGNTDVMQFTLQRV